MPRPFLTTDIVMLEEEAGDFALRNHLEGLREVEAELRFRKTERARRLLIEVLTWAGELERKQSQAQCLELETRLREAQSLAAQGGASQGGAAENGAGLYRQVGLQPDCPDFVLKAARRAFRKALHPDGQDAADSAEAHRRFQEIEAVFEQLEQARSNHNS